MLIRFALTLIIGCLFVIGCGPRKGKQVATEQEEVLPELRNFSANSKRITIMTWNMENLFDAIDNPKTDDEAYLPLEVKKQIPGFEEDCKKKGAISWVNQCLYWDWTDEVIDVKMQRLSQVIRSVNNGKGPDILVVQEIENLEVLERLIDNHLTGLKYKAYLIENHDFRGIDVGLITRLKPLKEPSLKSLRKRPGLVTQFDLGNNQKLNLVGVHFPISPTPFKERLEMLNNLAEFAKENPQQFTIAAGDFNFPSEYEKHFDIIKKHIKPDWIVSHLYCKDCGGTFYDSYEESWSQLDYILLSPNFLNPKTTWTLDAKSVHIHNPLSIQSTYDGKPADFNLPNMKGVSDHWPLVMQIVKTQ